MQKISNKELKEINGGIGAWGVAGLIALGIFIVGVFDGIARPLRCN